MSWINHPTSDAEADEYKPRFPAKETQGSLTPAWLKGTLNSNNDQPADHEDTSLLNTSSRTRKDSMKLTHVDISSEYNSVNGGSSLYNTTNKSDHARNNNALSFFDSPTKSDNLNNNEGISHFNSPRNTNQPNVLSWTSATNNKQYLPSWSSKQSTTNSFTSPRRRGSIYNSNRRGSVNNSNRRGSLDYSKSNSNNAELTANSNVKTNVHAYSRNLLNNSTTLTTIPAHDSDTRLQNMNSINDDKTRKHRSLMGGPIATTRSPKKNSNVSMLTVNNNNETTTDKTQNRGIIQAQSRIVSSNNVPATDFHHMPSID